MGIKLLTQHLVFAILIAAAFAYPNLVKVQYRPIPNHTEGDFIMCRYVQCTIEGSTKAADIVASTIWIQLHLCIRSVTLYADTHFDTLRHIMTHYMYISISFSLSLNL